ncbi:MAG: DUF1910 domain-containing protein [Saprospiraceae bacterium]|nr:DUF1910 domain-containing protein [Saprospiraceae bacterium]
MRDKIKNPEYFQKWIDYYSDVIPDWYKSLEINEIENERIDSYKRNLFTMHMKFLITKYSGGIDLKVLTTDISKMCIEMNNLWSEISGLYFYRNSYLKQYISSAYDQMIWMLSFATLLKIDNDSFIKLGEIIDRNGVVDILFEK